MGRTKMLQLHGATAIAPSHDQVPSSSLALGLGHVMGQGLGVGYGLLCVTGQGLGVG